jgi:hypothetical protein
MPWPSDLMKLFCLALALATVTAAHPSWYEPRLPAAFVSNAHAKARRFLLKKFPSHQRSLEEEPDIGEMCLQLTGKKAMDSGNDQNNDPMNLCAMDWSELSANNDASESGNDQSDSGGSNGEQSDGEQSDGEQALRPRHLFARGCVPQSACQAQHFSAPLAAMGNPKAQTSESSRTTELLLLARSATTNALWERSKCFKRFRSRKRNAKLKGWKLITEEAFQTLAMMKA